VVDTAEVELVGGVVEDSVEGSVEVVVVE